MKRFAGSLVLVCLCAGFVYAGCGRVRTCHSRRHHEHIEQYQGGAYVFEVGNEIQLQAFAEMVAASMLKLQQQQATAPVQPEFEKPPVGSLGPLVTEHCGGCHSNAQRPLDVSTCDGREKILRRIMVDASNPKHMPKGIELPPDVLGNLVGEVLGIQ